MSPTKRSWTRWGGVCLAAGCAAASADSTPRADHGAAPMADQEKRIATLTAGFDPAVAPKWIDPALWAASIPADNVPNPARIELGRKLYFDTRLSADGTVACATCHDVTRSFADLRPMAEGIGGKVGRRSSPTTMNAALLGTQFWDGRAASLEAQAVLPIINAIEMGHPDAAAAVKAIAGDADYQRMFKAAYGRDVNYDDIGRALASFERTLIFLDAPFDRWLRGEADAISADAKLGWVLFNGKGRCMTCHPMNAANPLGTDHRFHNIGVSARHQDFGALATKALEALAAKPDITTVDELALEGDTSELGRFVVTRNYADVGAFRTQQLRNVGITQPYMHDGSLQTLWDVMDHYNKGGEANPYLDGGIEPLALTDAEIDQIVAFMFTLTDLRFKDANDAQLKAQRDKAGKQRPFKDDDLAMRRRYAWEPRASDNPTKQPATTESPATPAPAGK
jgi:cytochrome c peroxidase